MKSGPTEQAIDIPKARSISGRVFVIPFVVVVLILGTLTFMVTARCQAIMAQLEVVRSLWPNASQKLKLRYANLETDLGPTTSVEARAALLKSRNEFDASSQFDRQSLAASQLEMQISKTLGEDWNKNDFASPAVSLLLEAELRRKNLQEDAVGWLTVHGLQLRLPPIYAATSSNRN